MRRVTDGIRGVLGACVLSALSFSCSNPQQVAAPTQGQAAAGSAVTAAVAGAVWVAGGGCKLQGCPYGSYCDRTRGLCVERKCSEGCPNDTVCNEGLGLCQAPPPPHTPNDFLPQDNARSLPPGTR